MGAFGEGEALAWGWVSFRLPVLFCKVYWHLRPGRGIWSCPWDSGTFRAVTHAAGRPRLGSVGSSVAACLRLGLRCRLCFDMPSAHLLPARWGRAGPRPFPLCVTSHRSGIAAVIAGRTAGGGGEAAFADGEWPGRPTLPAPQAALWSDALPGFSSVQLLSDVRLFATPWTAARQASLSITSSWSLLKLMSVASVMPSNHLILCHPLLLSSIFPSIRVFSSESVFRIRWSEDWSLIFRSLRASLSNPAHGCRRGCGLLASDQGWMSPPFGAGLGWRSGPRGQMDELGPPLLTRFQP